MLRKLRNRLFQVSSSSRFNERLHSQRRKTSPNSISESEPEDEQTYLRSSQKTHLKRRPSSTSLPHRNDKKKSEKLITKQKKRSDNMPASKDARHSAKASKRANSLPTRSKKKHNRYEDDGSGFTVANTSVKNLSKQKVSTWIHETPLSPSLHQPSKYHSDSKLEEHYHIKATQPNASLQPQKYLNRDVRRPSGSVPVPQNVYLNDRNVNFSPGQSSIFRMNTQIPLHHSMSLNASYSSFEHRPPTMFSPYTSPTNSTLCQLSQKEQLESKQSRVKADRKQILSSLTNHTQLSTMNRPSNKTKKRQIAEKECTSGKMPQRDHKLSNSKKANKEKNTKHQSRNSSQSTVKSKHRQQVTDVEAIHFRPTQGGPEQVGWEYHNVTLVRVPTYGFGIAVSGGRDNPHFMNADPSIVISDVLKAGPATGQLMVNDRIVSANGISLENVDYSQAISVLRECGNSVTLLIKRRAPLAQTNGNSQPFVETNNNPIKVTLTKANKKEDFGIVLGCKIYVKEITNRVATSDKDYSVQEGDIIHKINNTNVDGITLKEAKKLLESCKEKISLVISREPSALNNLINNRFLSENGNYTNGHSRQNSGPVSQYIQTHQRWPSTEQSNFTNGKEEPVYNEQQQSHANTGLASMVNGRVNNNWNNQNLYVQGPTRGDYQQMNSQSALPTLNESMEANDSDSTITSRVRGPISDISLTQLDQPATPILKSDTRPSEESCTEVSAHPLPYRPNHQLASSSNSSPKKEEQLNLVSKRNFNPEEPRYISFLKEGSVGIRLTGGNAVGIFVTAVNPGSPAQLAGLQVGDKILKANGIDMKTFTREEAVLYLLRIQDKVDLLVQFCQEEYNEIVSGHKGDSFFIKVHFNYDSEGKGELSFHVGDIFHVVETLYNGVVGSWFVYRLGRSNQEIQKGSIPNKSRADELAAEQKAENRSKKSLSGTDLNATEGSSRRGNFFKRRRSARRSKSLSKDHWEDVVFGDCASKFSAYERVVLKHPNFVRPVAFFGPLADIAREKFLRDNPDKFASPQALNVNDEEVSKSSKLSSSGIVRLSSIKEVIDKGKHALLDITPSAVDRLNYAQFYPIVIFMRAENKSIVKELRSRSSTKATVHRSSRKLFEQSLKLEKLWHHMFTASVNLTNGGDLWYKKLLETIEKQQSSQIWVAESKPEGNITDDFLFPMISRLSYASSPESDLDISANDSRLDEDGEEKDARFASGQVGNRLVKASSDPSLAHPEDSVPKRVEAPSLKSPEKNVRTSSHSRSTEQNSQRSPNKPSLHLLLQKALGYDFKDKEHTRDKSIGAEELKQNATPSNGIDDPSNYPTLRACDKYPQESGAKSESPLPPPPPTTSPPSNVKVQQSYGEPPPRIDRNSKPSRFRSAHERLFGSKSGHHSPTANYQNDDSDYINTSSPVKCEVETSTVKSIPNGQQQQQRFVTGAFGDTSSYSSDSFNKYGSGSSTLETNGFNARPLSNNERRRSGNQPSLPTSHASTLSTKYESLEKSNPLPPPPSLTLPKVELTSATTTFPKAPPSPPPKPNSKFSSQSLQYQMNLLNLNETRPPPPPKPLAMPPPPSHSNVYDRQSDYDNMPAICSNNGNGHKRPNTFHGPLDISNGPPGYYQSLPQYPYNFNAKDPMMRYSSNAEVISNFMNGPNNTSENIYNSFSSLKRTTNNNYLEMGGDGRPFLPKPLTMPGASPSKSFNYTSNYEPMRYNSTSAAYNPTNASAQGLSFSQHSAQNALGNPGPYLNLPFPSSKSFSQDSMLNNTYTPGNVQSSPLPPPPPLPTYLPHPNGSQAGLVQPTPQQPQSGQYLDLSLNRENRGSAFEVYRKPSLDPMNPMNPMNPMMNHQAMLNESHMFQGLPPPPPPLTVNDYNQYSNIDEITSSSMSMLALSSNGDGGGSSEGQSSVIATARGIFGSEGGSLVSGNTGVTILIPPGAIPDGVEQEIYFKVCRDQSLVPLDRENGETMLSPIVMVGPHGLKFKQPIELRLPHCAIVNPDKWSFALKASDTNNGEPVGWRNIPENKFNEQFVSVLVDHF